MTLRTIRTRLGAAALAVASLTAGAVTMSASPASAASMHGCSYPRVCLYDHSYQNGNIFSSYQQYGTQAIIGGGNRVDALVNTRNDDAVWLIDRTPGTAPDWYICIPQNTAVNLGDYAHPNGTTWANDADDISIRYEGTCDDRGGAATYRVQQGTYWA
ncbi:hypothetical protein ACFPH6_49885 [Streptomyces xiangluensis]|uniref:Peptidase inhibitor family I36 n=1 Tax=Streptomyces xiangluensis TaxID=2665720 RepID=A0ABV8Z831_9ACTN